ncbi:MAG: class I SAM-dependent methyltransferase [Betaproteobacteria bacterium]|nr:class I SAM-dependent methyltransferase [Betaproteobacteria bacterium]MBP7780031.1 class I SAM-dependent methyltransferase [Burkholderiaceae bacterium]
MLDTLKNWLFPLPHAKDLQWKGDGISDAWFEAHFNYAADVVAEWVGKPLLENGHTLDFGCGDGITALGLILRHQARKFTGVDISQTHKGLGKLAKAQIGLERLPRELTFQRIQAGEKFHLSEPCDLVITWSTFEHIELPYMAGVLDNIRRALNPDGMFFLQINPLYFSPFGSHLSRFNLPPWAHLLWTPQQVTDAVMSFAGEIPSDELEENFHKRDFSAYKQFVLNEYHQLNQLTTSQLVQLLKDSGFELVREGYGRVSLPAPAELLERFSEHDLLTDEVRLLLRKC